MNLEMWKATEVVSEAHKTTLWGFGMQAQCKPVTHGIYLPNSLS